MSSESPQTNVSDYHTAKLWQIGFFSLNNTATNIYLFGFTFLTYYATGIVGLLTLTVANIMGAIRLFDGLIDPTIGVVIDKTKTKFGKYRPYMVIGNIILIISFLVLFNIHNIENDFLKFAVFVVALIIHKTGYSLQATVTKAAQTALTNDPKQRPIFSIFDTIFSSILIFTLGQYFVSNFLAPRHGGEFNLAFFNELTTIIMVVSAICTVIAIIGISGKDKEEYFGLGEQTVETKGFKDYWHIFKTNKNLQSMIIVAGINKFVSQLIGDPTIMILLFSIVLGNYGLSGQMAIYVVIPNLIAIYFLSRLAGTKGLRFNYVLSLMIAIISYIGIGAIILISGDNAPQIFSNGLSIPAILIVVFYVAIKIFGQYPNSLALTMAADISDYETARSGRYVSGLISTLFSLTDSIASSFSPMVVGWVVVALGYTTDYPQIGEAITESNYWGTLLLFVIIPVVALAVALLLLKRYNLTADRMAEVQSIISDKKHGRYKADNYKDFT